MTELRTSRLLLRGWHPGDLEPWAAMNADPEVRRFSRTALTRDQSQADMVRYQNDLLRRGYGRWALEVHATGEFIGYCGLDALDDETPFDGTICRCRRSLQLP